MGYLSPRVWCNIKRMQLRIIGMGIVAIGIFALGVYMLVTSFQEFQNDNQYIESFPVATSSEVVDVSEPFLPPGVIITQTGKTVSGVPIKESQSSEQLAEGFYALTDDPTTYDIFYNEPTGVLFISLYKVPISFSRALAERKLLETLPLSKEEICTIQVNVVTNSYVDPIYDGVNLGLSFCPGSVQLP